MSWYTNLKLHGLFWSSLLILSLIGCKKEDSALPPPAVSFVTQANELSLQIPDSVSIAVAASDAAGLKLLSLTLVDASFQRIGTVQEVQLNGELNYSHSFVFAITSEQLRSGDYYLLATASNGSAEGRKFIKILLNEAPLRLQGILVLSKNGNQTDVTIFKADFTHRKTSWPGSYAGGAAFSSTGSFVGFEATRPQVRVLKSPDFTSLGGFVPAIPNTTTRSVTSLANDMVYAAFENGQILGYSRDLKPVFQYSSVSSALPVFIHRLPQHLLIVEQQRANLNAYHLYMIHPVAKGIISSRPIDFEPVYVYEESPNTLVFFGNRQGRGVVIRYYYSSNLITTLRELPIGKKIDKVFYDGLGNFPVFQLVAGEELITYNTQTDELNYGFGWFSGFGVTKFEPLTQTRVYVNRNESNTYELFLDRLGLISDIVNLPGRPLDIHFIYNR